MGKKVEEETKEVSKNEKGKTKPIIVCRKLFYSIINYVILGLFVLAMLLYFCNLYFVGYNTIGAKIGYTILGAIIFAIAYLLYNWLYKCYLNTKIAITDKEVRYDYYVPFYEHHTSIPLNKITAFTYHKYFWIFRVLVIHQYGKMPVIFPTWLNKEAVDTLNELINNEKNEIEFDEEKNGLLSKKALKIAAIVSGIVIGALLILSIIISLISMAVRSKYTGEYTQKTYYYDYTLKLESTGKCDYSGGYNFIYDCNWKGRTESGQKYVDIYSGSTKTMTVLLTDDSFERED